MPARSEPVPGSVIAIANIDSPLMNLGSHRFFCSSVPSLSRYGRHSATCTLEPPKLTAARESSSDSIAVYLKDLMPAPPYSSGTSMPNRPSSASL